MSNTRALGILDIAETFIRIGLEYHGAKLR